MRPFSACVGTSPKYLGARVERPDEEARWRTKKSYLQCYARLCEEADSLKALGSVASYMGNSSF
jgi:hypothetical protein